MKITLLVTLLAFTAAPAFAANPVYTDGQTTMNVNAGGSCKTPREQYEQFVSALSHLSTKARNLRSSTAGSPC